MAKKAQASKAKRATKAKATKAKKKAEAESMFLTEAERAARDAKTEAVLNDPANASAKSGLDSLIGSLRRRVERLVSDPATKPLVDDMVTALDGVSSLVLHVATNDPETDKEAECVENELSEFGFGFNLEAIREWVEQVKWANSPAE